MKMTKNLSLVLGGTIAVFFTVTTVAEATQDPLQQQAKSLFGQLPDKMPGSENDTAAMIKLGRQLYMDPRLSVNDSQSCNSCHNVDKQGPGVDNVPTSTGALGKKGDRNSPTVWNAGLQITQFWDGRAADLVEQAKGPILNPVEMAMPNEQAVVEKVAKIKQYRKAFNEVFKSDKAISYQNVAEAIAAFERTLITRDRFDKYLAGDVDALNEQEKRGLKTFIQTGCVSCHNGATLGGSSYQKMGLMNAYGNTVDVGRYNVTKKDQDKYYFKVSMLRDIERTAPYFHDGGVATLEEAVKQMAWLQLGQKLDDKKVDDIVAFLKSMTHQSKK